MLVWKEIFHATKQDDAPELGIGAERGQARLLLVSPATKNLHCWEKGVGAAGEAFIGFRLAPRWRGNVNGRLSQSIFRVLLTGLHR